MELEGRYWPGKRGSGVLRWRQMRAGTRDQAGPGSTAVTRTVVRNGVPPPATGPEATTLGGDGPGTLTRERGGPAAATVLRNGAARTLGRAAPVLAAPGLKAVTLHHEGAPWLASPDWGELETTAPAGAPPAAPGPGRPAPARSPPGPPCGTPR